MDLRRLRIGDWITGVCAPALLVLLWAPWYAAGDGTLNAWSAFGLIDLWLVLTGLVGLAVPVVTAARDSPAAPVAVDVICWVIALVAAVLVVIRLLAEQHGDVVTG